MPFVNLGPVKLYYQLIGQGRPVVFVNGWTMSSEYWMPLVEQLRENHTCLLYDPRGFGRSAQIDAEVGVEMDDHAEDLHALIEKLGLRDVNLVGHGIGAWTAMMCARLRPQDLVTLTAIGPEAEPEDSDKPSEIPSIWRQAGLILKDLASFPLVRHLVVGRYRSVQEPYRTRLCEDFAQADRRAAFHLLASCMGSENRRRLERALSEISVPVMLVRGTGDRICPEKTLRRLFDIVKTGKMATIRGCGHLPMIEYTKEFGKLLEDFFTKNGRPLPHALIRG